MIKLQFFIFVIFLLLVGCVKNTAEEKSNDAEDLWHNKKKVVVIHQKLEEEPRTVDAVNPPVILDIIVARKQVKPIKCSQLGKRMHQIILKHPFDSTFLNRANIALSSHHIVATTDKGIALFNMNGEFVEMVCANKEKFEKREGYFMLSKDSLENYMGSVGLPFVMNGSIFYRFADMSRSVGFWIVYAPDSNTSKKNIPVVATKSQFYKGKIITEIPIKFTMKDFVDFTPSTRLADGEYFAIYEDKRDSSQSGNFLTICTPKGDTICEFKDFDTVDIQSTYRNPESNTIYNLEKKLHIRQCYNDTIYCLTAPNKITPKYILNFNGKNINSAKEGLSIAIDLKEKFVVKDIKETKNYLFVFYTQNYDCPNTAINKTLKYNLYVFDKKTKQGSHAYIDEEPYIAALPPNSPMSSAWPQAPQKGLINDIDTNPVCWDIRQTAGKTWMVLRKRMFKQLLGSESNCFDNEIFIVFFNS